jgi:acyl-CoA dehydrogenase
MEYEISDKVPLSVDDLPIFFGDAHRGLAERLRAAAGRVKAAEQGSHDAADPLASARAVTAAMAQAGLFWLLLPEAGPEGDAALDVRALYLAREMLGYVSPLADSIFAVQGLGSVPIALAGSPAQRDLLSGFRRGSHVGAFALTEPEAGSDVASLRCTATASGDGFRLDGTKTFISNAGIATHYTVFATEDPAAGRGGIAAFLVEAATPGLTVEQIPLGADHPLGRLTFSDCRIPAGARLGPAGGGFRLAMQTLDTFRVTVGAAAVGMAHRALDAAVAHVRARVQFGKPLAEQQLVQAMLADMATELDASRLLVLRAAHAKDTGAGRVGIDAAMAKLYATEAAQRIIDHAVQLHGGRGVVAGEVVETLYRAIRPLRIYEGTSEIQRLIIGRAVTRP